MPMPCEQHPNATIFPDIGCGACWWPKVDNSHEESYDAGVRACKACSKEFPVTYRNKMQKYCTIQCRRKAHNHYKRAEPPRFCVACGKPAGFGRPKYCSEKCLIKFHTRKHAAMKKEQREAQRQGNTENHDALGARSLSTDSRLRPSPVLGVQGNEAGQPRTLDGLQV